MPRSSLAIGRRIAIRAGISALRIPMVRDTAIAAIGRLLGITSVPSPPNNSPLSGKKCSKVQAETRLAVAHQSW